MEIVFKALADKNRRKILDRIKLQPGITLQKLCEDFSTSRFAVMKHLKVLEKANLVVFQREGKFKLFYLNTIPIQMIYDRWLSDFTKHFSSYLTQLKHNLEKESLMDEAKDRQVYVLYIRTNKEKLWEAITNPDVTCQYFFNTRVQSEFTVDSEIKYLMKGPDGNDTVPVKGRIIKVEKHKKLIHSFEHSFDESEKEGYSIASKVSYDIEPMGDLVKLTVIHDDFKGDRKTFDSTSGGWPIILNGLKTLLETGEPLQFPSR